MGKTFRQLYDESVAWFQAAKSVGFMNGLRFRAGQGYRVPQALLENAARLAQEHLSAVVRATAVSLQRAAYSVGATGASGGPNSAKT